MAPKPTVDDLKRILDTEDEVPIEIMPNGEIRPRNPTNSLEIGKRPITYKEDLGGEYYIEG
ncbi:MAG: hypothetical protein HZA49_02480 [Planctomycetes bacterium]|nr:hypothetical protein [Planctomycetota bacterium]